MFLCIHSFYTYQSTRDPQLKNPICPTSFQTFRKVTLHNDTSNYLLLGPTRCQSSWNKLWGQARCGYTNYHHNDSDRFVWRRDWSCIQLNANGTDVIGEVPHCQYRDQIEIAAYAYDNKFSVCVCVCVCVCWSVPRWHCMYRYRKFMSACEHYKMLLPMRMDCTHNRRICVCICMCMCVQPAKKIECVPMSFAYVCVCVHMYLQLLRVFVTVTVCLHESVSMAMSLSLYVSVGAVTVSLYLTHVRSLCPCVVWLCLCLYIHVCAVSMRVCYYFATVSVWQCQCLLLSLSLFPCFLCEVSFLYAKCRLKPFEHIGTLLKPFSTTLTVNTPYLTSMSLNDTHTVYTLSDATTRKPLETQTIEHRQCANFQHGIKLGFYFGGVCPAPINVSACYDDQTSNSSTNSGLVTMTEE